MHAIVRDASNMCVHVQLCMVWDFARARKKKVHHFPDHKEKYTTLFVGKILVVCKYIFICKR